MQYPSPVPPWHFFKGEWWQSDSPGRERHEQILVVIASDTIGIRITATRATMNQRPFLITLYPD
jgi:hypothetical protein